MRAAIAARLPASPERPYQLVDLNDRLEVEALDEEFLDGPVEACVARICRLLGLPGEEIEAAAEMLPVHAAAVPPGAPPRAATCEAVAFPTSAARPGPS